MRETVVVVSEEIFSRLLCAIIWCEFLGVYPFVVTILLSPSIKVLLYNKLPKKEKYEGSHRSLSISRCTRSDPQKK